jgi:signal transduction histidine kinase
MSADTCDTPRAPMTAKRPAWRWGRTVTMAVIGGLVAFAIGGGLTQPGTLARRAQLLAVCLIYGHCIALTAVFAIPRWLRRFTRRNRVSWLVGRVLVLPVLIFIGGSGAWFITMAVGLVHSSNYLDFAVPFLHGGPAVGMVAAIFVTVTGYEYLRDRIDAATLELRTKQRDEAEARRLAAEAQLASLESRVQPHFLFNTLNSIAALIPQDPAGAEKMTGQLASLLRSSLDAGATAVVPLEQEIKTTRDYLDIERVRFGDRLRYDIRVDATLADTPVPRMSLQTLVENSVKYAVAPRREGGAIVICAVHAADHIHLSVSDDGPGFDAHDLPEGHGLMLIKERLQKLFGGRAALAIASAAGNTTVTIELPA